MKEHSRCLEVGILISSAWQRDGGDVVPGNSTLAGVVRRRSMTGSMGLVGTSDGKGGEGTHASHLGK